MRPLSYSKFTVYNRCPLMFRLSYIDRLPERPKPQYSFGRSVHKALELFNRIRTGPATLDHLLGHLQDGWIREGYSSPEMEAEWKDLARAMLKDFFEDLPADHVPPLAVEHPFNAVIGGIPMTGRIDAINRLSDGRLEIVDYKSGDKEITEEDPVARAQLGIYQLAVELEMGTPVGRLTIHQLRFRKKVHLSPLKEDARADLLRSIIYTANMIQAGEFEPLLSHDCPCDWPEHCPYFKDLHRESGQTKLMQHDPVSGPSEQEIDAIVTEYAALIDDGKRSTRRARELENQMRGYCNARDIRRIFSNDLMATMLFEEEPHSGEYHWRFELSRKETAPGHRR